MGIWEIIVIIAAAGIVAGVIAKSVWNKKHKKGGCCGDCSHCSACAAAKKSENPQK
ncbi:MAG: FeoB-associated Cys-rich membrane protein [Bacillota bacterium]|nr:MAG: FeoB-associated Cys-rich membrane protein [Bacillota bacterium]